MKKQAKSAVASMLWKQVRVLRAKNQFKVVAVVGSIGKTSTKFAIAKILSQKYKVRFQEGNYNDITTVPLVFFDLVQPNIKNPAAWLKTVKNMKSQAAKPYPYDVVVVELGTDGPGQIKEFAKYLEADISVITAVSPEHMEHFGALDAVAKEELSVKEFSDKIVINSDLIGEKYTSGLGDAISYGTKEANYTVTGLSFADNKASFSINRAGTKLVDATMDAVAKSEVYSAAAAATVGDMLGLSPKQVSDGIGKLTPVSGRMQRLKGIKNSLILDETYNASPEATIAALDSLYGITAKQKIAILGNMNELGQMSAGAHKEIGEYCEPEQIDLLVTIGPDANKYTAQAARKKGCNVMTFGSPYDAGSYVKGQIREGAVILAKGSQNDVFAEEAIKQFLADPKDEVRLVRQSKQWMKIKRKNLRK